MTTRYAKGFTLLEMFITIAILGIVTTLVITAFSKLNSRQALDKSADLVVSILNEARSLTLSSSEATQYGVNFQTSQIVLFAGASYATSSVSNIITPLNSYVEIRDVSLTASSTSVVFKRLSGKALQTGSIKVFLKNDPSTFRIITVSATGMVEKN